MHWENGAMGDMSEMRQFIVRVESPNRPMHMPDVRVWDRNK